MFEKILQESHFGEKPFLSYLHFMMCIVCTMLLIPTTLCTENKITQKMLPITMELYRNWTKQ